ncbi:putative U box domain, Zinc finger, RING/FYVE/PHD-type [Helianthus annuus]|nr:putative U box domain, Zinc finger, RING/FYVE/PHD-type [Helianthus annuus]
MILQIQLVHSQFKRAKTQTESPDSQLQTDLTMVKMGKDPDPEMVKRLSEKLHLTTIDDLRKESLAIHEMVVLTGGGEFDSSFDTVSFARHRSPVIPDDFRCPISLELMKDPVIVSTGQVCKLSYSSSSSSSYSINPTNSKANVGYEEGKM